MATVNLANESQSIITEKDSVIVRDNHRSIPGGRSLNVTGFPDSIIREGHLIIQETATKEYKPWPVSGNAYAALPAGHTFAGILVASIRTAKPFAGISLECSVNRVASRYSPATLEATIKTANPNILFFED